MLSPLEFLRFGIGDTLIFGLRINSIHMKKIILTLALICPFILVAQQPAKKEEQKVKAGFGVSVVQVQPQFPGGSDSLDAFIKRNIKYPTSAVTARIHGRVYVGYQVDHTGKIKNIRVLSGVNTELDNEALQVVQKMPDWIPGSISGSPVDVQYVLPVDFIIPKNAQ